MTTNEEKSSKNLFFYHRWCVQNSQVVTFMFVVWFENPSLSHKWSNDFKNRKANNHRISDVVRRWYVVSQCGVSRMKMSIISWVCVDLTETFVEYSLDFIVSDVLDRMLESCYSSMYSLKKTILHSDRFGEREREKDMPITFVLTIMSKAFHKSTYLSKSKSYLSLLYQWSPINISYTISRMIDWEMRFFFSSLIQSIVDHLFIVVSFLIK